MKSILCLVASSILAVAALSGMAEALTVTNFANENLQDYYGRYGPRGDCGKGPIITMDVSGFGYDVAGKTSHSSRIEVAYSFFGNSYQGICIAFFPFARSDNDFGSTTLILNDDEVPGKITISNDGPPPISAVEQALAKGSPYMRCGGRPRIKVAEPAAPPAPAIPLAWSELPKAASDEGASYDFLHKGEIANAVRALIGADKIKVLEDRLFVTGPIQQQGAIFYVSGNAEHLGGQEQAYVLMDATQKHVQVGLWEGGKLTLLRRPAGVCPRPRRLPRCSMRVRRKMPWRFPARLGNFARSRVAHPSPSSKRRPRRRSNPSACSVIRGGRS